MDGPLFIVYIYKVETFIQSHKVELFYLVSFVKDWFDFFPEISC